MGIGPDGAADNRGTCICALVHQGKTIFKQLAGWLLFSSPTFAVVPSARVFSSDG